MSSSSDNKKVTAYIENMCCECQRPYPTDKHLLKHLAHAHLIYLNGRPGSEQRPISLKYQFVNDKSKSHQRTFYGCPSCWFYCDQDIKKLMAHIQEDHLNVMSEEDELLEEDDDAQESTIIVDPKLKQEFFDKMDEIKDSLHKLFRL